MKMEQDKEEQKEAELTVSLTEVANWKERLTTKTSPLLQSEEFISYMIPSLVQTNTFLCKNLLTLCPLLSLSVCLYMSQASYFYLSLCCSSTSLSNWLQAYLCLVSLYLASYVRLSLSLSALSSVSFSLSLLFSIFSTVSLRPLLSIFLLSRFSYPFFLFPFSTDNRHQMRVRWIKG